MIDGRLHLINAPSSSKSPRINLGILKVENDYFRVKIKLTFLQPNEKMDMFGCSRLTRSARTLLGTVFSGPAACRYPQRSNRPSADSDLAHRISFSTLLLV